MITAATRIPSKTRRASTASVAAPLGGWNARDPIGAMRKLDAVQITNWFPGTGSLAPRKGYTRFCTGITGQVESLMTYNSGTASKLFAAATTKIYNVTAGGTVGAAVVSSLTNARWQYVNFTVAATASYMLCVNGADKMRIFDGTNWHADGDGSPYDVTNVDTATCININVFKNRIWLIPTGTLKAWYLPINAIGGAAVALDMSALVQQGGYLMAGMNWTIDAGYGMDDYLAFITSQGEVLVWRLTDPTTPTGIALIGVYNLGSPVGRRCWVKYGGDLLIITQDGVIPMAEGLQSSRLDPRINITDKIQKAVSAAVTAHGSKFGWELLLLSKENQLYLNVPVTEGNYQQQYVQNNITKSWCNFTGWNANCWALLNDDPYFGSNTFVGKAWNGNVDHVSNIESFALQAFSSYGSSRQKQAKMIRFHLLSSGVPKPAGNVNVDYDLSDTTAPLSAMIVAATWDADTWDHASWAATLAPSADWQGVDSIGYTFAPALKVSSQGMDLEWLSTDIVFEEGGVL